MLIANPLRAPFQRVKSQSWSTVHIGTSLLNWVAASLLLLTSALLILAQAKYTETARLMDRTREVSLHSVQLLSTVKDAETGQRGFLITGDSNYLESYRDASKRVDAEIGTLHRLTADSSQQQERLDRYSILSHQKFVEMGETIALRRRDHMEEAAGRLVMNNLGQAIMRQLRKLTQEIGSEPVIEGRIRDGRKDVVRILLFGCGSILICVACSLLSVRLGKQILFESEERFRALANFIPPLAWIADKTGWIFWYNQRWYDYTGQTSAEMEKWGWKHVHDPDSLSSVLGAWESSIATGQPFQMEFPLRGADGSFRVFLSRVMPWKDKDGNVVRWFGTHSDINDLKLTQHELRHANEKLEARVSERTAELLVANKELEAFAYSVSHDLRAPLRHLDGFAEMLRKNCYGQIDAQGRRCLDKITNSAQRMGRLIDDLLAFSRLLRADVSRTQVSLQGLQEEVRRDFEPDLATRTVVWTIGDLPDVYGDRSMLRQVFINLLSNAVKYTRDRLEARIEIGCSGTTEEETTIFVRDNGAGFEMEYVNKLFGVFQRLHGEEFEGTGVGLANVRRIVERHGGRVWAEGVVDKGATFYCTLRLNRGRDHA
jgi:PAS domain S-box-containing protein